MSLCLACVFPSSARVSSICVTSALLTHLSFGFCVRPIKKRILSICPHLIMLYPACDAPYIVVASWMFSNYVSLFCLMCPYHLFIEGLSLLRECALLVCFLFLCHIFKTFFLLVSATFNLCHLCWLSLCLSFSCPTALLHLCGQRIWWRIQGTSGESVHYYWWKHIALKNNQGHGGKNKWYDKVRSSYFDWNEVFLAGAKNKIVTLYSFKSAAFDVAMEDMLTSSHIEQGNQMISTTWPQFRTKQSSNSYSLLIACHFL